MPPSFENSPEDEGPRDPTAGSAIGARVETDPDEPAPQPERPGPQPSRAPSQAEPASAWRRLGAYVVDSLILTIPTNLALELAIGQPFPADIDFAAPAESLELLWPFFAVAFGLELLYFAGFEASKLQATLGKHLLKIQVADEQGQRVSFLRAFGRNLGKLVSALPLGLGFLMIFTSGRNQALHDHLASCLVLERGADEPAAGRGNLEGPEGGLGP